MPFNQSYKPIGIYILLFAERYVKTAVHPVFYGIFNKYFIEIILKNIIIPTII